MILLLGSAAFHEREGDLDELARYFGDGWFEIWTGGLDAPLKWTHDDVPVPPDLDDRSAEELEQAREEFEGAVSSLGENSPTTLRELAQFLCRIGLVRANGRRWWVPEILPLPTDLLPFPQDVAEREDGRRWAVLNGDAVAAILNYAMVDLNRPDTFRTTIDGLAMATTTGVDRVRTALSILTNGGDLTVAESNMGPLVDPEIVASEEVISVTLCWDRLDGRVLYTYDPTVP